MSIITRKIPAILLVLYVILVSLVMLALTTKGKLDGTSLKYQSPTDHSTNIGSPFEASNTTARYALTQAIVEQKSFFLTLDQARFASPDVVDYKGKYLSIFTPGVSFIGVPFYYIGKLYGIPQLATFFSINAFAILNVFLISRLARKLGANTISGYLGGLAFLLSSNALSYAHTFTQHHIATAILLIGVLNITKSRSLTRNMFLGILFGIGALVDIPNVFMMLPIVLYALSSHFQVKKLRTRITVSVKPILLAMAVGLVPFIALFAYYNIQTAGSPTLLAQTIGRSDILTSETRARTSPAEVEDESTKAKPGLTLPFNTRRQIRSSYILLVSDERSWIYYSPVVLLGILGMIAGFSRRRNESLWSVIFAIIFMNITIYSLFGDPWGGWGFGPRYLIPSAAFLCVGVGYLLSIRSRYQFGIIPLFVWLMALGVWINTLGAITTTMIPPKVEAVSLPVPVPHTYKYNEMLVSQNNSGALLYNMGILPTPSLFEYHTALFYFSMGAVLPLVVIQTLVLWRKRE